YSSLLLLGAGSGGSYPWGDAPQTGVAATQNPNPNLKWERTAQYDLGVDFGLMSNRLTGSAEYYVKNTSDLLLSITLPQPAVAETELQNVGKLRNRGVELSLDALAISRPTMTWRAGLTFSADRHRVVDLGPHASGLTSGGGSGQGRAGPGYQPLPPSLLAVNC